MEGSSERLALKLTDRLVVIDGYEKLYVGVAVGIFENDTLYVCVKVTDNVGGLE